jgi:hypothetical protein
LVSGTQKDEDEEVAPAQAPRPSEIVILDDTDFGILASAGLAELGCAVTSLLPETGLVDRFEKHPVRFAAINLASYASWRLMRGLRCRPGAFETPLIAYVLGQEADTGFWLGSVDFAVLPAGEAVIAAIKRLLPPASREERRQRFFSVIGMGGDSEVMGEVRAQLRSAHISATLVFDVRQLLELVPTVRPQAAFFHAAASCLHLFPAIAGLRSHVGFPNLPVLFLLDAEPNEQEEGFFLSGARLLQRRGNLTPEEILERLASEWRSS